MTENSWKVIQDVRKKSPLVHNITNYVVMNTTANAILAIGASPVMAHSSDEVCDIVRIADSLVINIGTLSEAWVNAMKMAVKQANDMNKPVVLDPVGAGASSYRNSVISELIENYKFSVIRGNASEIISVVSNVNTTKGVDSTHKAENAIDAAIQINKIYGSVVCISGETDYIISDKKIIKIKNGHPMMAKVTGMGCTATALIGAFIGTEINILLAVTSAMSLMGVAGELASMESKGPASLQMNFLDKLYNITHKEYLSKAIIEQ